MNNNINNVVFSVLKNARTTKVPKQREEIISILNNEGYPIYEKVLEFQEKYGGLHLIHGMERGLYFSICEYYKNDSIDATITGKLNKVYKIDGEYYFESGYYHVSAPVNILIGKDGIIYEYDSEFPLYKVAESAEELIYNLVMSNEID
ncbi:hypothetical protein [Acetivibrio cellulolyticus]|uniref:hypothetical protein n=1 Tax=Acetivibrio cellulolyticus TaxID=35830 RepID=UPI0002481BFC|nr:hypothetical protein [Acetivibrio cellulolyticus]